jgi:hypothetical protein
MHPRKEPKHPIKNPKQPRKKPLSLEPMQWKKCRDSLKKKPL